MKVAQSCPTLCDPTDCTVHGILQARILEWVSFTSPGDLSNLGIESGSPALHEDSLPAEPPGKPKNTGVGSLSLLHWIFLTQESNQDLLHCRRILYQLATREAQNIRFIYLLAALGLHCSAGFSLDAVCGLLVVASLVAEHAL